MGFQQTVPDDRVRAACRRALGADARVTAIAPIGVGTYNCTLRVEVGGHGPLILQVAPDRDRQTPWDRDAMRNLHAAAPFFATLGGLVPRTVFADFTHEVVDRDWTLSSLLPGLPASEALERYPRERWTAYYRRLGAITRRIHDVRGDRFGRVLDGVSDTWSAELGAQFRLLGQSLAAVGLDPGDAHRLAAATRQHGAVLDEIAPRLLHGDLWQLNILLDADADEPTIVGILDWDCASWGDPWADWTVHRVRQVSADGQPEAAAFWETYGEPPTDAGSALRRVFYEARHKIGVQLDLHRREIDRAGVPPVHWSLDGVLDRLDAS